MKGARRYLLVGGGVYLLALLWQLPAAPLYDWLAADLAAARPPVALSGVSGRLLGGEARELSVDGQSLGRLGWQLSSLAVLLGRAAGDWQLHSPAGRIEGELATGLGLSPRLEVVSGRLQLAPLLPLLPSLPVQLEGELVLRLERLTLDGATPQAEGVITWHGAAVEWLERLPLGDLVFTLVPAEGGTLITLGDQGGPLQARGTLLITPDHRYRADLTLATRTDARPGLVEALSLLGRSDGEGGVVVRHSGRF